MEPADVTYEKKDYVVTKLGNKISKKSVLCGSDRISVFGKTIIEPQAVIRGDLSQVSIGKYCLICERVVLRGADQLFKGGVVALSIQIGDHCIVERDTVVEAQSVGSFVHIGKNCVIGKRCVLKDCVQILDNTVLAPGTVVPPFTVFGGSPGRFVRKLPESFQLSWTEHTKTFYRHFKPS